MPDLTILGAGIFGLSIAWAAVRRGASVTVIDPAGPGAGASGGVVGALAPHAPEQWSEIKDFQLDALLSADRWWAEVAAAGGLDPLFARHGRLQPLADDAAVALAEVRAVAAADLWQGRARWSVVPASPYSGWLPPPSTGLVIHDTLSARIAPRPALDALVAAIRARGGRIVAEGTRQGAVIHATGHVGLAEGRPPLGSGIKGQAALLQHDARGMPQIFADGLHIVPHGDGTTAIGSTTERDWVDPAATDELLDAVISRAREICPALAAAPVVRRWAGARPRSRSRQPILGEHPLFPGEYIANGGFKIGFGVAPRVAEVMVDLVLDGRDTIPDAFRA
jgi:glycine oxidase